jgi:soluble lytic murein transglycosylase-like protein
MLAAPAKAVQYRQTMGALPSRPAQPDRASALPGALRVLALGLFTVLFSPAARAQIYGTTDDNGAVLLSNHEPAGAFVVLVEAPPAPPPLPAALPAPAPAPQSPPPDKVPAVAAPSTPRLLTPIIREAARKHALPEALLNAMVSVESGFDGRAVSPKGAKGLMQLMPETARRFGVRDVFAADQNVHAGAAYLRSLLNQFSDDIPLALAAYNAGEGAVLRAGRRIPAYPETQQYVRKVMAQAAIPQELPSAARR